MKDLLFAEYLEAIMARLKAAMPKSVYVGTCAGTLDMGQLTKISVKAPALMVSVLKVLGVNRGRGQTATELRMGIYLVTSPKGQDKADVVALALLPRILNIVYGEDFNLDFTENRPEDLDAEPLYSGQAGTALLSLWGISWKQRLILPELYDFNQEDTYPWNDPLEEFLRTCQEQTEEHGLTASGMFNLRTENKDLS